MEIVLFEFRWNWWRGIEDVTQGTPSNCSSGNEIFYLVKRYLSKWWVAETEQRRNCEILCEKGSVKKGNWKSANPNAMPNDERRSKIDEAASSVLLNLNASFPVFTIFIFFKLAIVLYSFCITLGSFNKNFEIFMFFLISIK